MPVKHGKWMTGYAHMIKLSFCKKEFVDPGNTSLDEVIETLYPEPGEHLSSPICTDRMLRSENAVLKC